MPDDPYSLADLARLADVTPRTVRYYVAQGLLPAPEVAGPATRYTEGHLLRLRLIRRLQRDHLPLAEIRVRIERMGDAEVQATLDAEDAAPPAPPMGTDQTLAYVRSLMTKAGVAPRFHDRPGEAPGAAAPLLRRIEVSSAVPSPMSPSAPAPAPAQVPPPALAADAVPYRPASPGSAPIAAAPATSVPASPAPFIAAPRSTTGDRTTWERVSISPDVELHVRRPLERRANKRVERLVRIALELFEEEP